MEYDESGNAHLHASTLDDFEHFWVPTWPANPQSSPERAEAATLTCRVRQKIWVDLGLGLFSLVNAGVRITEAPGGMTWLIVASLIVGKFGGILLMYKLAKRCGFYPPLGIRTQHIYMIGLIASIGLIVAIFVSDVAFKSGSKLQGI